MRSLLLALITVCLVLACAHVAHADERPTTAPADDMPPRIAVYDIDKVAADLGWTKDMEANLKELAAKFKTEFERAQGKYQDQINEQKAQWAPNSTDNLTADEVKVLMNMKGAAQQVLTQLNETGVREIEKYRAQWVAQYRKALLPTLTQIAAERKLWVILEKNAAIAYALPSTDISDAVTDAARAHPPAITPVRVPDLPITPALVVQMPTTKP